MVKKINVPKSAMVSTATLVYPPELTDERPSSWYLYDWQAHHINLSVIARLEAFP